MMGVESLTSRPGPIKVPVSDGHTSVQRTGDFLKNGLHLPQLVSPHQLLRPLPLRNLHNEAQRPLPDSGPKSKSISHHPRYLMPRSPLTIRTERPNENSSLSIEFESSGNVSDTILSLQIPPAGLFLPPQVPPPQASPTYGCCASPTSTIDLASRTSIATEYLFRQSTNSSSLIRLSNIPPFPPPWYPPPSQDPPLPHDDPRLRSAGLISPLKICHDRNPYTQPVSIIPEEISNARLTRVSLASSQAIPSSWDHGLAETVRIGACLDAESGEANRAIFHHNSAWLKATSVGEGDKSTIRTISKSHPTSIASTLDSPPTPLEKSISIRDHTTPPIIPYPQDTSWKGFASPTLSQSDQCIKIKKALISEEHTSEQNDEKQFYKSPEMVNALSNAAAETRSTTPLSLINMIRSATELASSLDDGRTASRTDANGKRDESVLWTASICRRNSGSFSDILAEFPPPGLPFSKGRGLLPVSLWRSKRRNIESIESNKYHDSGDTPSKRPFHGMSRRQLIMICIVVMSTIILAILLPILLVARSNEVSSTPCEKTTLCHNGGVSVSSSSGCSCVCANGYTGIQCTTIGDSSCVTSDVTSSQNATMGSSLPRLFDDSHIKFDIALNEVTVLAIFSTNNVSCWTEDALVSFSGANIGSDASNLRRSFGLPISEGKTDTATISIPTTRSTFVIPRSLATMNGILYDDSTTSKPAATDTTKTESSNSIPSPTGLSEIVKFSQVAVLYILEETGSFESAVNTKESIQSYLFQYYNSTIHPSLQVLGSYDLDFENKTITLPNGTTIGG